MVTMVTYEFTVKLIGTGDSEGFAWVDAVEEFCKNPGEPASAVLIGETESEEFSQKKG